MLPQESKTLLVKIMNAGLASIEKDLTEFATSELEEERMNIEDLQLARVDFRFVLAALDSKQFDN